MEEYWIWRKWEYRNRENFARRKSRRLYFCYHSFVGELYCGKCLFRLVCTVPSNRPTRELLEIKRHWYQSGKDKEVIHIECRHSIRNESIRTESIRKESIWINYIWTNYIWTNYIWFNYIWINYIWINYIWINYIWINYVWSKSTRIESMPHPSVFHDNIIFCLYRVPRCRTHFLSC